MRLTKRLVALCAVAVMAAACGGSSDGGGGGGGGTFQTSLQGTWSQCNGAGGISAKTTVAISGTGYTTTGRSFANDTCTGTGALIFTDTGTFAIGAPVTKTFAGRSVTAYEFTITSTVTGTSYDLVYVDTDASPDRLYTGDVSGANDGSSVALRPTVLDETSPLTKE